MPECLADELINASKGSANSHAIRRKDEVERIAKGNRWFLLLYKLYKTYNLIF